MRAKDATVILDGLPDEIRRIIPTIDDVWAGARLDEAICTSGCEGQPGDGIHASMSLHYKANWALPRRGGAIDLRTKFLDKPAQTQLADTLRTALAAQWPGCYDVVNHNGQDAVPRHIHVEYDRKDA